MVTNKETFEKVVEWENLDDLKASIMVLVIFSLGFISGRYISFQVVGWAVIILLIILFLLDAFPKRKVFWRKIK